jgi:hypothetical protein
MKLFRAVLISLAVTAALTILPSFLFRPRALGLFLFLPLSIAFRSKRVPPDRNDMLDSKPIKPS